MVIEGGIEIMAGVPCAELFLRICLRALLLLSCCVSLFYVSVRANPRLGPSPRTDENVEAFSLGLIGTNVYCFLRTEELHRVFSSFNADGQTCSPRRGQESLPMESACCTQEPLTCTFQRWCHDIMIHHLTN